MARPASKRLEAARSFLNKEREGLEALSHEGRSAPDMMRAIMCQCSLAARIIHFQCEMAFLIQVTDLRILELRVRKWRPWFASIIPHCMRTGGNSTRIMRRRRPVERCCLHEIKKQRFH